MVTDNSTSTLIEPHSSVRDEVFSRLTIAQAERFWTWIAVCDHGEACTACCWEWQGSHQREGYGRFWIGSQSKAQRTRQTVSAHRLTSVLTYGNIADGFHVCHRCDNPPCCNPAHLFMGSALDNKRDAVHKGRTATGDRNASRRHPERLARGDNHYSRMRPERLARGETHGSAKLTANQVRQMRALGGILSYEALAGQYGVHPRHVRKILQRVSWKHLPDLY